MCTYFSKHVSPVFLQTSFSFSSRIRFKTEAVWARNTREILGFIQRRLSGSTKATGKWISCNHRGVSSCLPAPALQITRRKPLKGNNNAWPLGHVFHSFRPSQNYTQRCWRLQLLILWETLTSIQEKWINSRRRKKAVIQRSPFRDVSVFWSLQTDRASFHAVGPEDSTPRWDSPHFRALPLPVR